jgi:hypothetical protein
MSDPNIEPEQVPDTGIGDPDVEPEQGGVAPGGASRTDVASAPALQPRDSGGTGDLLT